MPRAVRRCGTNAPAEYAYIHRCRRSHYYINVVQVLYRTISSSTIYSDSNAVHLDRYFPSSWRLFRKRIQDMEDEFQQNTLSFLAWFQNQRTSISPKIRVADLRHRNAGRGVGSYVSPLSFHIVIWPTSLSPHTSPYSILTGNSGYPRHQRR